MPVPEQLQGVWASDHHHAECVLRVTSYLKVNRSMGEHQKLGGHVRMPVPEQLTTPTKHQLVLEAVWRQSVQNSVFLRFATTCTTPPS